MKKRNAIMLADTRASLIGNILIQIQETNKGLFDEAIIYYKTITEKDKEVMNNIMPCKFIKYESPFSKETSDLENFKKFSDLMFARYHMFELLDEYETIMWIDTDVVIKGELTNLINKSKITGMVANFESPDDCSYNKIDYVKTCFKTQIPFYDMEKYNMSSGLIVVNEKLKTNNMHTQWLYNKTEEYADNLILPDQGILNIFIQEFEINVTPAGNNGAYCFYPSYKRDDEKAIIVHSWGSRKFWNNQYLLNKYPEWKKAYDRWISLGGSKLNQNFNPIVSVIIPCYKPNIELMEDALRTLVVDQTDDNGYTYENSEIIIVTEPFEVDKIEELIKKFDDNRIRLIVNKERMGIAKSLNIGIKNAKGKYIARMDDDDLCKERRIYKQVKYLEEHKNIELVTSDFEYIGDMWEKRYSFEGEMSKAWSIFTCPFDHPTIMFRKDFFIKNNLFYDETRGFVEDWELWLRAFDKGMRVGCIHEILFFHRWHNGSAGQNNKTIDMMRELIRRNFKELNVEIKKEDLPLIGPWNGKVSDEEYKIVETIFNNALEHNKKIHKYDQFALEKVFKLRLFECKNGYLKGLFEKTNLNQNTEQNITKERPIYKKIMIKIGKIFYNPIRNRLRNLQYEVLSSYDERLNLQHDMIQSLTKKLDTINAKINTINETTLNINVREYSIEEKVEKINEINLINIYKNMENLHNNLYDAQQDITLTKEITLSNIRCKKKIFLIGTSEHNNIGDTCITCGELSFLKKYYKDRVIIEVSTYEYDSKFDLINEIINENDIILLQGGGNLGNKFLLEENLRRKVISTFKNNKIIILPQTIYFDDTPEGKKELKISANIYNNHKNLTMLFRGNDSYDFANKNFINAKKMTAMDLTLFLKKSYDFEREKILLCLRDLSDESGMNNDEYNEIKKITKKYCENFDFTNNLYFKNIKKSEKYNVLEKELERFAQKKLVITDRLHGMLFSIITKTPCIVFSSYNNKIKEFYKYYSQFCDNKYIIFLDHDLKKLEESIKIMLNKDLIKYPELDNEIFDNVYKIIEENNND